MFHEGPTNDFRFVNQAINAAICGTSKFSYFNTLPATKKRKTEQLICRATSVDAVKDRIEQIRQVFESWDFKLTDICISFWLPLDLNFFAR